MQIHSSNRLFHQRVSSPTYEVDSPTSISSNQIKVLSIWKNFDHQSGIDVEEKILFRVESHVLAGTEFESK